MTFKTAIAIAVAGAFALPFAAQASADTDKLILAQSSGSTMQPKDSNPAAPPRALGSGSSDSSTAPSAPATSDTTRPSSGAAAGSSTAPAASGSSSAPMTGGSNSADRKPNTPKSESGATAQGGFAGYDKNNDGYISRDEAKDATWSNRFTELDKDNDGRLSRSEHDAIQAGAGATGGSAAGSTGAPLTSGTNSADRKPSSPKQ